jgi:outer membrane protein insertion porin family
MLSFSIKNTFSFTGFRSFLVLSLLICSCNITRKAPKGKPYLVKNSYSIIGGHFTKLEKSALIDRLAIQLEDSSKIKITDVLLVFHVTKRPPAYDSTYSYMSAGNMRASMNHLGYYNSEVSYKADTSRHKVKVTYTIAVGNATRIESFTYNLLNPALQELALKYSGESLLKKNDPVSKTAILAEINRQVDTFRNNGYYKFTAGELKMRGDTTIQALTKLSNDPFEQLQVLAEAQQKKDSPSIKLAMLLNKPEDSTKLNPFRINSIYVLPDYIPDEDINDSTNITERNTRNFILRYHSPIFRTSFLNRNILLRPGQLYNEREFNKTLANLSKTGVWQTVNIKVKELKDSSKINLVVELVPAKKLRFETALEASYSASTNVSNALAGNLIGLSGNISLLNRNVGREAIRMTHKLRAGIELNNNSRGTNTGIINSNEVSYSNNMVIPRNISFLPGKRNWRNNPGESFVNTSISVNRRLNLFNLQTLNLNLGNSIPAKNNNSLRNTNWIFKPLSAQFSFLNGTDSFKSILKSNPFLNYSYNTSFVIGMMGGFSSIYHSPKHVNSLSKDRTVNINLEESGLTWGLLPIWKQYKRKFIKLDAEYKYTVTYKKTALIMRAFAGVGIPLFKDSALPFFKQFFGGGTYSMRGWPVRGIGRGGQALPTYKQNIFNDRTGDFQLEFNSEYRYDIAHIIPNLLTLRGAVFVDVGNIWNVKNSKKDGSTDSAQLKFKNIYKELGMSAGTGFRLDFNYVVLRFDLGFRFKRPEISYINNGWKAPAIGFDDLFKKIFARGTDDEYRRWRYENFNFTIGISYPF